MSFLRKVIGASFVAGAVQFAIPGFGVRELLVSAYVYAAVLILFPTPTQPKETGHD